MKLKLDEGSYMVLKAAPGAYSCRSLPVPQTWNPIKRPHVALLLPTGNDLFRAMLSFPKDNTLQLSNIDKVETGSIIEVRYNEIEFSYFRKDSFGWTKVGSSDDPFFIEVYTSGLTPLFLVALESSEKTLMDEVK